MMYIQQALLSAAKGLEERIAPITVQLAQVEKNNSELLTRLQQLESKQRAYKERASRAESILRTEKEERHRLNERTQGYLSVIKQKDKKIADLQQELYEDDKKVSFFFAA
jgi:chromosome segregation ATPase